MDRQTFGHYEVLEPLGSGGMGEVYAARDPKLGRRVAIKMLPQRLAGERDTLTRFTQEARSASALNHPNIVTIHEVGTDGETPFIVMEYIDGIDLRTLIREGALPVRRILDIAAQIADGLASAHERGIVHRDLKPENIMVTREGFVKILDFGLAKMITPAADGDDTQILDMPGTNPGTILGTVGYMSPEQASARRIDFRSDQFSFGAILYELVTGKAAFDGDTAIDILAAILHDDPTPVSRLKPRLPVQLADIIGRLLEKDADDRYSATRDLARELRLLRDRVSAEESGFHRATPVRRPGRTALALLAAAGLVVFIAAVYFIRRGTPASTGSAKRIASTPTPAATKYLAVMRFKDLTGDATGQLVVDGFAETLAARLSRYKNVQIMRPPAAAATEPEDPKKAARDLGANLVLTGSMMRDADRIRITYSILDVPTGREWRDLVEGNINDIFAVQDNVAGSVAQNLDLGTTVTTAPALDPAVSQRRYLEAVGHLRRYDNAEDVDKAIEILQTLGSSPSVQSALANAYVAKFVITRQPELAAAAGQAADRALKADPQSIEANITLGELQRQTGRYPEAISAFLRVLSQQPYNADAVLGLAETYKAAGDAPNAEANYKRAIELRPNFWGGYNKLGAFYFKQARLEEAAAMFRKVVELVPDNQRGYNNLGAMYQRLGRYDDAVRVFSDSVKRSPSGQGYSNLGTCYYFLGRYRDAAAALEKSVALTPHDFLYWRNLGDAYRWVPGEEANARRAYTKAIELCDDAIKVNPREARAYLSRASALAKIGRVREARASILRALELEPQYSSNAYEAAVIANIDGSEDEAAAFIEQALRLGYNADDMMRDPEFANLRKTGRLQSIIAGFRSNPRAS